MCLPELVDGTGSLSNGSGLAPKRLVKLNNPD